MLKKLFFVLLLVYFMLGSPIRATSIEENYDQCPFIVISGDPKNCQSCSQRRYVLRWSNDIKRPTFKWSVSVGNIIEGQGTGAIIVDASNFQGKPITVKVELDSISLKDCPKSASYTDECTNDAKKFCAEIGVQHHRNTHLIKNWIVRRKNHGHTISYNAQRAKF